MMNKSPGLLLLSFLLLLSVGCDEKPTATSSSAATAEKAIDWQYQIAYQRGVEAVNWAIPTVSMVNLREAYFVRIRLG